MKLSVTVTRRVSSRTSMKESASSSRSCESRRRRGQPQSTRGIRKRCRIRAGWRHEWIPRTELPSRSVLAIREVVRGPFSSPRLIGASPYVLVSSKCKKKKRSACRLTERCPRIKRGIPDPWAEYLAYRGFCSKDDRRTVRRDINLGCKNIYVTATVWKNLGLPLGQGIPDPWKIPAEGKWVSEKRAKRHGDRRHQREKHRGYCKPSKIVLPPGSQSGVNKAGVDTNPAPSSPLPRQKPSCKQISQQLTLQRDANFRAMAPSSTTEYQALKATRKCSASRNTRRKDLRDSITKPPILETPTLPVDEPEQVPQIQSVAEIPQPFFSGSEDGRATKKSVPVDRSTQTLTLDVYSNVEVRDTVCMCQGGDFRKGGLSFGVSNSACTDHGGQTLNQNLNVTQLPCGCVHISSCNGRPGNRGSINERPGFGESRAGATFPEDAPPVESPDQRQRQPAEEKLSEDRQPKKISKMKRLLSRWKEAGKEQIVKSDDRVDQVPSDSKLVCCQCSCPYLKIESPHATSSKPVETQTKKKKKMEYPSHGTSSKPVETKRKKCACTRCIAKRERREKRRIKKVVLEEQATLVNPKSCQQCIEVESPNERMKESPEDVQVPKNEAVTNRDKNCTPSALPEDSTITQKMKEDSEIVKNTSRNVNSPDVWECPAIFGAPWYSSDSGENADVSEPSRHTMQHSAMLQARPETSSVTSCTFISRLNHSLLLQCLKKREKRPNKKESLREELDVDCTDGRSYLPRPDPGQNSSSHKTYRKTNEKQIPLLCIEASEANGSQASPRPTCIDPSMGLASFSKDEETSQSSSSTSSDNQRRNCFSKCTNSAKREVAGEPIGPKDERDSIKSNNQLGDSQRSHLITPRTETILETRSSTDVESDEPKVSNPDQKIQESAGCPTDPEDLHSNFESDPMITTVVSPRRMSTDSCTVCSPDNCPRECTSDRAPANSAVDGSSSEEPRSVIGKQDTTVYRCEVPFTPGPYFTNTTSRSNQTKGSCDSTPRFEIGSPAKTDEFLERHSTEETEKSSSREYVEQVRILLPNESYQDGRKGSVNNKCYLKYCNLRQSGPCVVSPSNKIPKIQDSSLENKNVGNHQPGNTAGKHFPLGRKSFSSASNQRNPTLFGNAFSHVSQRLISKLQDKLDMG